MAEKLYGCGANQGKEKSKVFEKLKNTEAYKAVLALGRAALSAGAAAVSLALIDRTGADGSVFLMTVPVMGYAAYCTAKSVYHTANTKLARGFVHAAAKVSNPAIKKFIKPAARKVHVGIGKLALKMMEGKDKNSFSGKIGAGLGRMYLALGGKGR